MKRVQLFEFEDFAWLPSWLRNSMTNLLVVLLKMMGIQHVISSKIKSILINSQISNIVDLGTGPGGVMPLVFEDLQTSMESQKVQMFLSDLFPSQSGISQIKSVNKTGLLYLENSVDATHLSTAPNGLKTMVNCFHHMPPKQARAILKSAFENKQPFLIYEMAENKMPFVIWVILLPISMVFMVIMVVFMTPFVKPLTWQQFVFTYLIPIIPFLYAWDGQASMPRMYSMDDMDELLDGLSSDKYSWTKEIALNH